MTAPRRPRRVATRASGTRPLSVAAAGLSAAGPLLATGPAHAAPATGSRPFVDCVIVAGDGTYRAVFGYSKGKSTTTVPIGPDNTMTPSSLNGIQPTTFQPGTIEAAFATPWLALGTAVSWTLNGTTATATPRSRDCGPEVSLPAEGNGVGPVIVLAGSVLVSVAVQQTRRWRARRRVSEGAA